jgi:YegS/Rv2252/BmrU family lipid kinase
VSGHSKTEKEINEIIDLLKKSYAVVDIISTSESLNAEEISRDNLGKYETYVVLGGDGTFSETIRSIAGKENRPLVGYIPSGTINDVALSNGIPFNYKKAVDVILTGKPLTRSSMILNGTPVGFLISTGIFTSISYTTNQEFKRKIGKIAYYIDMIFRDKGRSGELLEVSFDGETRNDRFLFAAALNNISVGGLRVMKRKFQNEEQFYLILVRRNKGPLGFLAAFLAMARAIFKRVENFGEETPHVLMKKVDAVTFKSLSDTTWNTDGEKGPTGDAEITYKRNQFELIVPENQF